MVKKRLSDLLREEARRSPDPEALSGEEEVEKAVAASESALESPPEAAETKPTQPKPARTKPAQVQSAQVEAEVSTSIEDSGAVLELQTELQNAKQTEAELRRAIAQLQSGLQEQQALVHKLQTELERTEPIKAELEQAKQVILQLSEINTKSTQELEALRKEKPPVKSTNLALQKILQHSVQPGSPATGFTNEEIGWVD